MLGAALSLLVLPNDAQPTNRGVFRVASGAARPA